MVRGFISWKPVIRWRRIDMPLVKGNLSGRSSIVFQTFFGQEPSGSTITNRAISLGGPTSTYGNDSFGLRNYVNGLEKVDSDGSPNSPCLLLRWADTFWRFQWVVKTGQRRIAVRVKQLKTFTDQRPRMIIKASPTVGLTSDLQTIAPEGTDWVLIGPTIFTATGTGMVYVEIWNKLHYTDSPLYIDHIVVT